MTMYNTLLLDRTAWDLVLDSGGNIALAKPDYSLAQDVESAIRLFIGELYYDSSKGIPYFEDILGHLPSATLLQNYLENAALSVPGVVNAQCIIQSVENGFVKGEVLFIDENGVTNGVNF